MEKTLAVINQLEKEGIIGRYAIGGAVVATRRQALAALSWEEKVAIIEQMRVLQPKGQWKHRTAEEGLAGNGHADQHKLAPDAPIEMEGRNQ